MKCTSGPVGYEQYQTTHLGSVYSGVHLSLFVIYLDSTPTAFESLTPPNHVSTNCRRMIIVRSFKMAELLLTTRVTEPDYLPQQVKQVSRSDNVVLMMETVSRQSKLRTCSVSVM
jgi:hypothetical protein